MRIVQLSFFFIGLAFVLLAASHPASCQDIIPAARKIDWSYAGIPGGIPTRTTICKTIDSATYGNGSTDATVAIQTALSNCPSGQVVYVPAGTYLINGTIKMVSKVTLRGAGKGITILKAGGSSRNDIVFFSDNYFWDELYGSPLTHNITSAVKDSKTVTLDSVSGISVGDVLLLNQLNDNVEVTCKGWKSGTPINCPTYSFPNSTNPRSLGQFVEVTAINGTQVSTNVPLHHTFDLSLTPWAYVMSGSHMLRYAGLESMTLTQDTAIVLYQVWLEAAQYCWVKDVEISKTNANGIFTYFMFQCQITGNYVHESVSGNQAGVGYGIALTQYSCNNLVDNNILDSLSNGGISVGPASGNVFAYNYFHNITFDPLYWAIASPLINHGAHPVMNLWEGNVGYKVHGDDVFGSSNYQTIFRSRSFGYQNDSITATNAAVQFSPMNHYMNVVGSVLGTTAKSTDYEAVAGGPYSTSKLYIWVLGKSNQGAPDDSKVVSTLFRHGNYDYVTNSTSWDPNISDHNLPASLYLSGKPSWWCSETPWPPIGPDVVGKANIIPAQRRLEGLPCTSTSLAVPGNLRTIP